MTAAPDPAQWKCLGSRHDRVDYYGEIPLPDVLGDVNADILLVLHPLDIAPMGPLNGDPHRLRPEKDYPSGARACPRDTCGWMKCTSSLPEPCPTGESHDIPDDI